VLGADIVDLRRTEEIATAARAYEVAMGSSPQAEMASAITGEAHTTTANAVAVTAAATLTDENLTHLAAQFPGAIAAPDREGHAGCVVAPDHLTEVARYLRDQMGFDYLSSLTAVDYATQGYFEVVYHALSTERGGAPLAFRARTDAAAPALPSLVSVWPGAEFQEREAWDLMGVRFEGHPDLRRILLWEGFEGHPLRKDWREPYYEADPKPFKSRWPAGHHLYAEERTPWGDNVQYPAGYILDGNESQADPLVYAALQQRRSWTSHP
jgi:NADH-quinone oxidoreductase subunit D/NADH-quinone oxidoreductase subunit C/D